MNSLEGAEDVVDLAVDLLELRGHGHVGRHSGPSLQPPASPWPPGLKNPSTGTSSRRHSRWGPADAEGCNPRTRRGTGGDGELGLGKGEAGRGTGRKTTRKRHNNSVATVFFS